MTTATTPPSDEDILTGLREAIAAVLDGPALAAVDVTSLDRDTPLLSLPLDSLKLVETMTRIEDRFRVFIPEQKAFAFTTVGEVVDYVRDKTAEKAAKAAARQESR